MTFGLRRPHLFAAIYASRPRVRYGFTMGDVSVPDWNVGFHITYNSTNAPLIEDVDGGGSVMTRMDCVAYAANTANEIPWVGWCVGWNDGFTLRSDHVAMVAAMRSAGRGFAFAWNNGDHGVGDILTQITATYPPGTFKIGQGYPVFSEHSLDGNPATDLVGGINVGLRFRNVTETASGWSCEVTHASSACTVKVKPYSKVFLAATTAQLVTITAPNAWATVSFTA
jgi:hypothetical protein